VGGLELGAREKAYLKRVIDANRVSYGPFSRRFERSFARAHGCAHGVFCNSGTSALHVAVQALKERHGWKDGDEVLVPSVTFVATANVVLHNRLTPVFVDVDPRDYCMDPALIEARITKRTRAIIPVHLVGLPADMPRIMEIARRRKLRVIEDSCETVFAKAGGKVVGSFGDIGCFSTYVAHYIVTGVGGLATTNDPDLAVRLRSLINHGRDSIYLHIDAAKGKRGRALEEIVARRFRFTSFGHSFRATEFEAALGVAQLERRRELVRAHKAVAARLTAGLSDLQDVLQLPWAPAGREHVFMLYPIVVRGGDKTRLVDFLEARGVETRDLLPLLNQPAYRERFGDLEKRYPVARLLNRGAFYIGCHQYMTREDADFVCDTIHEFFRR
jgi:CDP-6-deoxy-D-xylo-4-hexulose-3-dehydrase